MVPTKILAEKADLTKVEVGEIDTRAPFQSVKDAVNLFGDKVSFSGDNTTIKKAKPVSPEKSSIKETGFNLAQKELNRLKEQVQNAENTKAEALAELQRAKQTMEDLSWKLKVLNKSNEAAEIHTEEGDPKISIEDHSNVLSDLNDLKQELAEIRQDYDMSLEEKAKAVKLAEEAEFSVKENREKASKLTNEISALKERIEQVKNISSQSKHQNIVFKKLESMKKIFDPEVSENLETQLDEVMTEIENLRKDFDSVKNVFSEVSVAKESLRKMAEEENVLESVVDSLRRELEISRKEKEKELETESVVGNLHVKLRECKSELEVALTEEAEATVASKEMYVTLNRLELETENARCESEETRAKTEELKKEAEATRVSLKEAEERLVITLREAEEAKNSESKALDKVKAFTEQNGKSRSLKSFELGAKITISRDEFEALSRKIEESAINANESGARESLESIRKEIEDIKASTEEALKEEKNANEAKKVAEGELRRLRETEHKNAPEIEENERRAIEEIPTHPQTHAHHRHAKSGPIDFKVHNNEDDSVEKSTAGKKKLDKQISLFSRKTIGGVFTKKKGRTERGSPSGKK